MEICDGIAVIGKHPVPQRRSQPELEERRQSFSPTARGQPHSSSSCHSLMLSQQRLGSQVIDQNVDDLDITIGEYRKYTN